MTLDEDSVWCTSVGRHKEGWLNDILEIQSTAVTLETWGQLLSLSGPQLIITKGQVS